MAGAKHNHPPNLAGGRPADSADFLLLRRMRVCRPHFVESRKVLVDFGCGNGAQTVHFAEDFPKVWGVDVNREFLADFRASIKRRDLESRMTALEYPGDIVPLEDGVADQVISFTVLEHVPDQDRALEEMYRLLRPGGRLIMSVPNKWWVFETHGANLPLLPWNRVPFVSWWPKGLHDKYARARIYRAREIEKLVRSKGFEVREVFRMTAPLDVLKWRPLQDLLRGSIFKPDTTGVPFLATEVIVVADKPE